MSYELATESRGKTWSTTSSIKSPDSQLELLNLGLAGDRTTTASEIGGKTMARLTKADVLKKAEDLKNWGKWGPDDELGVLYYVTPEDIVNAAKLVR